MTGVLTMLVEVPTGGSIRLRRFGKKTVSFERAATVETRVTRVARVAMFLTGSDRYVEVDAFIPEVYRHGISSEDSRWVGDGVLRTKAYWCWNQRTIERFWSSGLQEWLDPEREAAP